MGTTYLVRLVLIRELNPSNAYIGSIMRVTIGWQTGTDGNFRFSVYVPVFSLYNIDGVYSASGLPQMYKLNMSIYVHFCVNGNLGNQWIHTSIYTNSKVDSFNSIAISHSHPTSPNTSCNPRRNNRSENHL